MNIKAFSKEIADYFNLVLNDADMKRLEYLVDKYSGKPIIRKQKSDVVYVERKIFLDITGSILAKSEKEMDYIPLPEEVISDVAKMWGYTVDEVVSRSKSGLLPSCRFMIMMILKEYGYNYRAIGLALGGRDHSTAIYGVQEGCNMLDQECQPLSSHWKNWCEIKRLEKQKRYEDAKKKVLEMQSDKTDNGFLRQEKADESQDCVNTAVSVY